MGKLAGPYNPEYPKGTKVQIVSVDRLTEFFRSWNLHHPLDPVQLAYAGLVAEVESIAFYHGGDKLYILKEVPGIWHEVCLEPVEVG
jgi:hypothetical protein